MEEDPFIKQMKPEELKIEDEVY
ncbi:hypothetical protein DSM3645_25267 [Blastopirellula marina DSM 3645]|uniref:Uncharacterized protein n=1 Tax=Blastopirellula marina DSM 3645 TaxID=314230 RepID=A4A0C1_9BACT|nr:hypothetical protein DSM3645_25267 [Blastopirellula marina DSM 3645]